MTKDLLKKGVSTTREKFFSSLAIITTLLLFFVFLWQSQNEGNASAIDWIDRFSLGFIVFCNVLYLTMRYAYFYRLKRHQPAGEEELAFCSKAPMLTILIPSYKEEHTVVRQTLLSSALQDYPSRRVVLLIDDPPISEGHQDWEALEKTRSLIGEVEALLAKPFRRFEDEKRHYFERKKMGKINPSDECLQIAALHEEVAAWFEKQRTMTVINNHVDSCFVELTYIPREEKHRRIAEEARKGEWGEERIEQEYSALAALFKVELSSFERKRYENLSHAPNKAMNLNSYIGLMGKQFLEVKEENGLLLHEVDEEEADLSIPESDYVAVLDADTLLVHNYSARLIHHMEQPGNEKIAVIQTPYSAFPNAKKLLERIAGATTDMQYITHQGYSLFNATFWVGANAIARMTALNAIVEIAEERGYPIRKFVQDRTVIEDTESSIDLINKGWTLYNYPERLSYSATPEDFGSLLIQRRRWANGGLLILPKLLKYLLKGFWKPLRVVEVLIRMQYLAAMAAVVAIFVAVTLFPEKMPRFIGWSLLLSMPYLLSYGWDLKLTGYRFSDLFRVIALNIVLLPVNAAGVVKSLEQALTGRQIPFCRTPKVVNRTAVPSLYVLLETALVCNSIGLAIAAFLNEHYRNLELLSLAYVLPACYGYIRYLGLKNNLADLAPLWERAMLWGRTWRQKLLEMQGELFSAAAQQFSTEPPPSEQEESA